MQREKLIENIINANYFEEFVNNINSYDEEQNYIIRQNCMNEIMNMNKLTFLKKLKENKLPNFVRAKKGDKDYIRLYRDTNSALGEDYAYNHRERLRTINVNEYKIIANYNIINNEELTFV